MVNKKFKNIFLNNPFTIYLNFLIFLLLLRKTKPNMKIWKISYQLKKNI